MPRYRTEDLNFSNRIAESARGERCIAMNRSWLPLDCGRPPALRVRFVQGLGRDVEVNPEQPARESDNAQHLKMFRSLGSQQTPLSATQVRPMRSAGSGERVSVLS
jgi:hypothetical protein